ncbi:hypothetical protein ACHAXT_003561 [Thalassiosira profunda]
MKVIKRRKKRKRTARAAEGGGAEIEISRTPSRS